MSSFCQNVVTLEAAEFQTAHQLSRSSLMGQTSTLARYLTDLLFPLTQQQSENNHHKYLNVMFYSLYHNLIYTSKDYDIKSKYTLKTKGKLWGPLILQLTHRFRTLLRNPSS